MNNTVAIIGTGKIGSGLAKHLAKTKFKVLIANKNNSASLNDLVKSIGGSIVAVSIQEAIEKSDVLFLAVPWLSLPDVATVAASSKGKLIIDATNNITSLSPFQLAEMNGKSTGEYVSELFPSHRVVKAFNTLPAATLSDPTANNVGNTVVFISSDNDQAKRDAEIIIEGMNFFPIDIGSFKDASKLQEIGHTFSGIELIKVKASTIAHKQ